KAARRYVERWDVLVRHAFDPTADLLRNSWGVLELAGNKPALRRAPRKPAGAGEAASAASKGPARPGDGRTTKAPPKPGAALKSLSDSWQKATRRPAGSAPVAAGPTEKPARGPRSGAGAAPGKPPRSPRAADPRPGPGTGPRSGPKRPTRPRKD
ncbi:MAG: hypothetical protein EAZ40_08055, partial [Rhodobacterales bacterium]